MVGEQISLTASGSLHNRGYEVSTTAHVFCAAALPTMATALDPAALSDAEKQMIARSCRDAQRAMQRLETIDPISRVNRAMAIPM